MSDVLEVSASDLLSGNSTETPAPKKRKKSYREDFPDIDFKETFPGSNVARHPVTNQFVSLKPKPRELAPPIISIPGVTDPGPEEVTEPEHRETPQNPAATPAHGPTETGPTEPTGPAEERSERPPPDFSDLNEDERGGGTGPEVQPEIDPAAMASHRQLATVVWDSIIGFLAMLFGKEWFPRPPAELGYDEREGVINSLVDWFASMRVIVLSPFQTVCLHVGNYCWGAKRIMTFVRWFKERKEKRANATHREPEAEAKGGE